MNDAQSQALYNHARAHRGCHVVIDPLAGNAWADCLRDVPTEDLPTVAARHEYFGTNTEAAPKVLHVPLHHFDLLDALARLARTEATDPAYQTRSVCGMLASELAPQELARRLAANLTIRVGPRKLYFRFFDPRVMYHLAALLPSGMLDLRGIAFWAYFDWEGGWVIQSFAAQENRQSSLTPMVLTEDQWRPFEALAAVSASVAAFKQAGIAYPCADAAQLRLAAADAMALGLREHADVATYLLHSRKAASPLTQHQRWKEALALVQSGASLAEALDGLGMAALAD